MFFFTFFSDEKSFESFGYSFLISALYAFSLGPSNGIVNEYLNKKFSWTEQTTYRTILGIVATIVVNFVVVYFCNYINFVVIQKASTPEEFFSGKYNFTNWFFVNFALMIAAFLHAKGFMEELKKTSKKEVVQQKLIANSANAQFESLKNQLDPHFLFNSLNVLSALIDENPGQAQKFTASMSKIYRYVLEQKDKELVTVSDEIEFAKTYCNLLKTRFEDSVDFEFEVKKEDEEKFVVPLSLQLLLENCIKHNFATSSRPLKVKVFTEGKFLSIENNLQVREQLKESAGIGLANIVQRYSFLTKENVFVEKSEHSFKVKIPVLTEKMSQRSEIKPIQETENLAYQKAVKRVKELKEFYISLVSYCVIIPLLIFINVTTSSYQWFWFPLFGWGMGLAIQAVKTFAIGKNWEEKEIEKIMRKNKNYGKSES